MILFILHYVAIESLKQHNTIIYYTVHATIVMMIFTKGGGSRFLKQQELVFNVAGVSYSGEGWFLS